MSILTVPATVTLVAEIAKSGVLSRPVAPISPAAAAAVKAYTGRDVTGDDDRLETHAAMLDLLEQGKSSTPAYKALAARLMRLNGE